MCVRWVQSWGGKVAVVGCADNSDGDGDGGGAELKWHRQSVVNMQTCKSTARHIHTYMHADDTWTAVRVCVCECLLPKLHTRVTKGCHLLLHSDATFESWWHKQMHDRTGLHTQTDGQLDRQPAIQPVWHAMWHRTRTCTHTRVHAYVCVKYVTMLECKRTLAQALQAL